jgi:hypothetical protein
LQKLVQTFIRALEQLFDVRPTRLEIPLGTVLMPPLSNSELSNLLTTGSSTINQHSWHRFHRRVLELLQKQLDSEVDLCVEWQPTVAAHYMLAAWHIDQRIWVHARDEMVHTLVDYPWEVPFSLSSPSWDIIQHFTWLANVVCEDMDNHPAKHLLEHALRTAHKDITSQDMSR